MAPSSTRHPSEIDGASPEYQTFLATWGSHCGAPRLVFQGHLNGLIQAELKLAGHDLSAYLDQVIGETRRVEAALVNLLTELLAFLESHDCVQADHLGRGCSDSPPLIERLQRALAVLRPDDVT